MLLATDTEEVIAMGNVAKQCPTCRSWDVDKRWNFAKAYYVCGNCGYVWGG